MSYQEKAAEGSGGTVFLMALVFVFLILAAQYESWKLPFSVLLGVPAAIFGAFLGLWLGGLWSPSYVNNVFAQIGLVMLIGLTAKNAILIVRFQDVHGRARQVTLRCCVGICQASPPPYLDDFVRFYAGCGTPAYTWAVKRKPER